MDDTTGIISVRKLRPVYLSWDIHKVHICSRCSHGPWRILIQYVTASLGKQSPPRGKEEASLAQTQGLYLLATMKGCHFYVMKVEITEPAITFIVLVVAAALVIPAVLLNSCLVRPTNRCTSWHNAPMAMGWGTVLQQHRPPPSQETFINPIDSILRSPAHH